MYNSTIQSSFNTPVVLIIYNRPICTEKVFTEVAKIRPKQLFIIADGPKSREDELKCKRAREVVGKIDWSCEVQKNFSANNLGCKNRVSSGLDWVFSQCEEAIILEDDCLPNQTFFSYCEELLRYYREDERIMAVSGNNFQPQKVNEKRPYSYYFSIYNHNWGWASWARAWKHYDVEMKLWPQVRESNLLFDLLHDHIAVNYWKSIFDHVYNNKIDTWDYQWTFANWINHGLSVLPKKNLVRNIGFGLDATHTVEEVSPFSNLDVYPMPFPLEHPPFIIRDIYADMYTSNNNFVNTRQTIIQKMKRVFFSNMPEKIKKTIRKYQAEG